MLAAGPSNGRTRAAALMVNVFYSPAYVLAGHAFETTRKARWIAESLSREPLDGIALREPPPLRREQVTRVHDAGYVGAVESGEPRELAESQGFVWDAGLWPAVLASNGGAVAAALDALEHGVAGSLSSGLHHARRDRGRGFCTLNGLAIAACEALAAGARSVLVLDLDAHCGGGTVSLLAGDERVRHADVSTDDFDHYDGSERDRLEMVTDGASYLPTIHRMLSALGRRGPRFDLCLYNAGMDPCEDCPTGGLRGVTGEVLARRERMVFDWCRE
jgi:acetoin utilization deacetylase AcuC-like enzyme